MRSARLSEGPPPGRRPPPAPARSDNGLYVGFALCNQKIRALAAGAVLARQELAGKK